MVIKCVGVDLTMAIVATQATRLDMNDQLRQQRRDSLQQRQAPNNDKALMIDVPHDGCIWRW